MSNFAISIDKNSLIPIYRQIEEVLRLQILNGRLHPYDSIPSENELSKILGVSPMTIRQAMSLLVQDGYVYRERGKGTFVAPPRLDHPLTRLVGFSEDMKGRGLKPGSQILDFKEIRVPEDIAKIMTIAPEERVMHIKRLRMVDEHPVGIHDAYVRDIQFSRDELEQVGSLYALLQMKGTQIEDGQDSIEAIPATEEMSRLLKVAPKDPLLRVTRLTFTADRMPVELVLAVYRSDFYRYKIQLKR